MDNVASHLASFRHQKLRNDLRALGWSALFILVAAGVILIFLESIFWFASSTRVGLWRAAAISGILAFLTGSFIYPMIRSGKLARYSLANLAKQVGFASFEKHDQVVNALQLEDATEGYGTSRQLVDEFISQVVSALERLNPARVLTNPRIPAIRTAALAAVGITLLLSVAFSFRFSGAANRLIHPRTTFPVPVPFELVSQSGNMSLMGGDTAKIIIVAQGSPETVSMALPDSLYLEIIGDKGGDTVALASSREGQYLYSIPRIVENLRYRGFVPSRYFWQPWDEISTPTHEIQVRGRPAIKDFELTIFPPSYSGVQPMSQKGNIAEIRALKGSILEVSLTASKPLSKAHLSIHGSRESTPASKVPMTVEGNRAKAEILIEDEGIFETHLFDLNGTQNLDPVQYTFMVVEDGWPIINVLKPESDTELGSDFSVPVRLHVEDDFGFTAIHLVYETRRPDYLTGHSSSPGSSPVGDQVHIEPIHDYDPEQTSQDITYIWDLTSLGLMPEDEVHFHFEVYDNDEVSGPKKSVSNTLVAEFPSLADLYARTENQQDEILKDTRNMVEELKELKGALGAMELELLKNARIDWRQEQTLKNSRADIQKKLNKVEELRQQVQDMIDHSERHSLYSPELVEKFHRLQSLLEQITTPELLESLQKMRTALDGVTAEELLEALKNLRTNTARLEEQLDRFIDIFERIQAEQSMDELVSRTEALVERQKSLLDKLTRSDDDRNLPALGEDELRIAREFVNVRDLMARSSKVMEPFARMPSGELSRLASSDVSTLASQDLKAAARDLKQGRTEAGTERARSGRSRLQQVLHDLRKIQDSFQRQTVGEMMAKFQGALDNTLFISKSQEALRDETLDLPHNSARLGAAAARQYLLRDQLRQLTQSLVALSKETFAVTPEMGKAIGRATAGMNESLQLLEERNGRQSAQKQGETVAALNLAALETLAAMNQMEQSGMASGLQQFLDRMQDLAGSQGSINEQTLQLVLGQMEATAQEGFMKRLLSDQERVRKSLEELMSEMRRTPSGRGRKVLESIDKDIEQVIKDFQSRDVNRQTVERQQRILSRMLDSQRSIRQRDFSDERKATVAEEIVTEGPSGLPAGLGQRRNLALEALNLALKAGYSRDYQDMLRRYFNSLMTSPEFNETNP